MIWQLDRVISGGQFGADETGVRIAKAFGIPVGGTMPKGFLTIQGPKPEYASLYNMKEHSSEKYPPRTERNVRDSDGTIRFALDFNSRGEICTLNALLKAGRPYFDVYLSEPKINRLSKCVDFLMDNEIKVLNIAGNASEKTGQMTEIYLRKLLTLLGYKEVV